MSGASRTPDPPPGSRLPLPDRSRVVNAAFSARPDLVRRSCQERGGTWEFLDYLVDELRKEDNRWGYNGKRGNAHDPSQDIVDYHWGAGPSENSTGGLHHRHHVRALRLARLRPGSTRPG